MKLVAVPVMSPDTAIVLDVWRVVAVSALPVRGPENAVAVTVPLTSSFVVGVFPIPTSPEFVILIRSVGVLVPSTVVLNTNRVGISFTAGVPSTIDSIRDPSINATPSDAVNETAPI